MAIIKFLSLSKKILSVLEFFKNKVLYKVFVLAQNILLSLN